MKIRCIKCKQQKEHKAKSLCQKCYDAARPIKNRRLKKPKPKQVTTERFLKYEPEELYCKLCVKKLDITMKDWCWTPTGRMCNWCSGNLGLS